MDMKLWILLFVILLFTAAHAIRVKVRVPPVIRGDMLVFNYTSGRTQSFYMLWENTGSVGCRARARVEFYNASQLAYVGWSEEVALWPGASGHLHLHTRLPAGNYTFRLYLHHCYETFSLGSYTIRALTLHPNVSLTTIDIREVKVGEEWIEAKLRAKLDVEVIAVVSNYPAGWIFESARRVLPHNKSVSLRLGYEPSIWRESPVTLEVVSVDGRHLATKHFVLRREVNLLHRLLDFVSKFFLVRIPSFI